ncbi:MAG: SDR family NAD(P)-dependent oxidoreductase, partial [Bacteroidaceae bacterium]|nr:SDR family NAD(P)-dependent oxidoreductase [Bacteroidaceae bacterium]
AAYNYFAEQGQGHIAVLSSIAGTKGLGAAPSYSATKRFQNTYIQCLAQQARIRGLRIRFTDIRPGFVDTELLKGGSYPMLMSAEHATRRIVKALYRQERTVVVDWRYAVLVFFWKLIPDCIWEKLPIRNK